MMIEPDSNSIYHFKQYLAWLASGINLKSTKQVQSPKGGKKKRRRRQRMKRLNPKKVSAAKAVNQKIIAEPADKPSSGAPLLSKFGNLSIWEILVVTSAYVHPYRLWGRERGRERGRGRGVPRQPDRGWRMPSFLGGKNDRKNARCFWATGVCLGGKSRDHRRFWKEVSSKSLAKLIVRQYWSFKLEKKTCIICKWKGSKEHWWKAKSLSFSLLRSKKLRFKMKI